MAGAVRFLNWSECLSRQERQSIVKLVWEILLRDERRKMIGIFFLMLVGSVLETMSLGLIVPAMGALTNPNYLEKFPVIDNLFGNPSPTEVVTLTMGVLVFLYLAVDRIGIA